MRTRGHAGTCCSAGASRQQVEDALAVCATFNDRPARRCLRLRSADPRSLRGRSQVPAQTRIPIAPPMMPGDQSLVLDFESGRGRRRRFVPSTARVPDRAARLGRGLSDWREVYVPDFGPAFPERVDAVQDRLFYGRQVQVVGEDDIAVDDQARGPDHDGEQVRDIDHPRLCGDDLGHFAQHGGLDAAPGEKVPVGSQQEHRGDEKQQADERARHRIRCRVSRHLIQDQPGRRP